MMAHRRALAPVLALAAACHHATTLPLAPSSTCYALEYGAWSRGLYSEPPPAMVALDTTTVSDRHLSRDHQVKRLRPDIRQTRPTPPPASWSTDSLGVVHLQWSTGYTGYVMSLNIVDAATLRGSIRGFRDVFTVPPTPDPKASVIARRRDCSALGL